MTQYELINKWRKEAEKLKELCAFTLEDREWDRSYAAADAYEKCANDLEALTY